MGPSEHEVSFFNEVAFPYVVGEEGRLSMDPLDPGNWTGGKCNVGTLLGTKFGVSAKSYPHLDIANLTLEDARVIAKNDYWDKFHGDSLLPAIALCVFDFGYNAGVHESVTLLQRALRITEDGICGPKTIGAANIAITRVLLRNFTDERMAFYQRLPGFPHEGKGWMKRAALTMQNAMAL